MKKIIEDLRAELQVYREIFDFKFTWKDGADHEYVKAYNRERYAFKKVEDKLSNELIKLEVQLFHQKVQDKYDKLKVEATNPRIQKLADEYHKIEGPKNDFDDYDYGNWNDDVRMCMLEWYMKVKHLEEDGFNVNQIIQAAKYQKLACENWRD